LAKRLSIMGATGLSGSFDCCKKVAGEMAKKLAAAGAIKVQLAKCDSQLCHKHSGFEFR